MSKHQIFNKIKEKYYLIDAKNVIKNITEGCTICKLSITPKTPKHQYYTGRFLTTPRCVYYIDMLSGITEGDKGQKHIILCVEAVSGFVLSNANKFRTAEVIKKFIIENIIVTFGFFEILVMDGDLATANSNDFQTFLETYNIQKISSSAYSNWQIGAIEQKVAKTKENVRKIIL